jgi:hypothetical protein
MIGLQSTKLSRESQNNGTKQLELKTLKLKELNSILNANTMGVVQFLRKAVISGTTLENILDSGLLHVHSVPRLLHKVAIWEGI